MKRLILIAILLSCAVAQLAPAAEFHVAPNGNDANPGTAAKPFATLERARDAVRAHKRREATDVVIHGGTYVLKQPLVLTPADSGTEGKPVRYVAAKGETPVITSAKPITGWKLADSATPNLAESAKGKVWVADVPQGWRFHFLYAGGKAMPVARWHKGYDLRSWAMAASYTPPQPGGLEITLNDRSILAGLPNNGDVGMDLLPECYWNTLAVVRDINPEKGTFRVHSKNPTICSKRFSSYGAAGRFTLMNALKFLTLPGEWCVDSAAGKVYFWPETDATPDALKVVAPGACRLISLEGSDTEQVRDMTFLGLSFSTTDRLPEDQWPDEWIKRQAELPDAMLFMKGAERCTVEGCRFENAGGYAVALNRYAQNNRIAGNEMGQLGCGGVMLQGYGPGGKDVNKRNVVTRNYIHHTGKGGYMHSAAVTLYQSGENTISLNWIDHTPYAAVQICGVRWNENNVLRDGPEVYDSYGDNRAMYGIEHAGLPKGKDTVLSRTEFKPFLHSRNNIVENNIVTRYMEKLDDGGALYSWSCGSGNIWRGNLLFGKTHGWVIGALYMDDWSDDSLLENNIAWHTSLPTVSRGENIVFKNNTISGSKPADYDARLKALADEARKTGGWLNCPADQSLAISGKDKFLDKTTVSITSFLGGTIHYTLDGTTPTAKSMVYTAPIAIEKTTPVKAIALDPQGGILAASEQTLVKQEVKKLSIGTPVKAAEVTTLEGPRFDDNKNIGWCDNGGAFAFGPYEFKHGQLQAVEVMVGVDPQYAGGKLHVRLDEPNGPVIGTLVLASTGGFEIFQPQSVALWATPGPCAKGDATGTHLLWFTIEGKAVCNFKAFRVLDASGAISIPTRAAPTDPAGASADSRYQALCANAAKSDAKIAFVGDSVTQSWEEAGRAIWDKQIAPFKAINLGIGGDRVEHMIWRIENGNLPDTLNPKAVVIMAGTNNITFVAGITPEAIAAGNRELIARIRKHKPGCKVLLLGIFPRRDALDTLVQKANPELAKLADNKTVFFLDPGAKFRMPDGTPAPKYFADAVHISADGYQIWADAMLPTLKKLLAE